MRLKAMVFTLGLGVAACAAPPAPPPSVKAPPPRPQASRPPQPPVGVDPSYELPAKDSDGRFLTPNVGLGPLETMFNVRSALNVAALSCVTSTNTAPRDGYNRFLKLHKTVLANANKAIDAKYRREHGSAGIRVRDSRMTKLYNHYAYPPVKGAFCAKTARYLTAANAMASKDLETWSLGALADIEQDFQDHFRRIEAFQIELRDWQQKQQVASASQ
ncbi:hypothetical protein [Sphingosinicella microcystinivorans]|uniref:DUF4142 domain-containing protein n=1 Tax=Sphingosinicella microcystinivorans TaxID=335406 RepID=A0AAD1D7J0_SPHMI|nr:hypothetical protein [Sphingosinicella microcystinivorans]RKS91833.1 hypothetical protein DFR51_1404 [Sphingosinicella microcystinivorans]BBE34817.1 hypothetical protein SmB9_24750 [Sphingosinicella microcystinivorans]